jgi:peptidoglycan/xylan/chitin deacetylase (PgdA/CDA1 family)
LICEAGDEVAHHNYCHENPNELSYNDEVRVIEKGIKSIEKLTGKAPIGYRSPAWDLSSNTIKILLDHGFKYESGLMANDRPYRCRIGDNETDGSRYEFGEETELLELPVTWSLDDWWRFEFVLYPVPPLSPGVNTPDEVFDMWSREFDYQYKFVKGGVFTSVCHPQVTGRGSRILFLDKLLRFMKKHEGVWFAKCSDLVTAWRD